jgi:hypothetical protein
MLALAVDDLAHIGDEPLVRPIALALSIVTQSSKALQPGLERSDVGAASPHAKGADAG